MLFCKLMNQLSRQKEVTMIERFEKLTSGITQVYKSIQRIKKHRMDSLGLKGSHVMCIYYLSKNPEGLTAADLCSISVSYTHLAAQNVQPPPGVSLKPILPPIIRVISAAMDSPRP